MLGAFSGFGRHTANDFLFLQAIFPGMPSRLLCEDLATFNKFVTAIEQYLSSFTTSDFLKSITVANSINPFIFNETSNQNYMKRHILIFRRKCVRVDHELYVRYCKAGLFDPEHVMGLYLSFLFEHFGLNSLTFE